MNRLFTMQLTGFFLGWATLGYAARIDDLNRVTSDIEEVMITGVTGTSVMVESSVLLDFGARPTEQLFSTRTTSRRINLLGKNTIPLQLDNLKDEPQFGRYLDLSIPELERQTQILNDDANALTVLGVRLFQTNRLEQSVSMLARARLADPLHERSAELYSAILIRAGNQTRALREIRRMLDELPQNQVLRFNAACGYARTTNVTTALYHLHTLAQIGWQELRFHLDDRDLDAIRGDPNFAKLEEALTMEARERIIEKLRPAKTQP